MPRISRVAYEEGLLEILTLLRAHPEGLPVSSISALLHVPVATTKSRIKVLAQNGVTGWTAPEKIRHGTIRATRRVIVLPEETSQAAEGTSA